MRRLLLALVLIPAAWSQPRVSFSSAEAFADELRRIRGDLSAPVDLPSSWEVRAGTQQFSVPTEVLRKLLAEQKTQDAAVWLDHVLRQTEGFSSQRTGSAGERAALDRILRRPEFGDASPPTAWERFVQSLQQWIASLIQRIFAVAAQHPTASLILFWTVLSAAVVAIGMWLLHAWRREETRLDLSGAAAAQLELRSWQEWLHLARQAADSGDERQAIRCAYWAAIAWLQDNRALPANLTHTPRECVRIVKREPLKLLTAGLERFWYAGQPPSPEDVKESFRQLEALGCRVD